MGGYIVTEDARSDDTYQLQSGEVVLFTRANLARICADALRLTPVPAPATLDGRALSGRPVSTPTFTVKVNPGTADQPNTPYYQDSIDVGHPGRLTACYSGQKALVHLKPGRHVLRVDLTGEGLPTRFTYYIDVDSNHR